jgi:hypothetical protein
MESKLWAMDVDAIEEFGKVRSVFCVFRGFCGFGRRCNSQALVGRSDSCRYHLIYPR